MIPLLLALALGLVAGAWLTMTIAGLWVDSQAGRRHKALAEAENRIRNAQAVAFSHMADVAEAAVYEATGTAAPTRWPSDSDTSDDVLQGEVVRVQERDA